MSEHKLILVRTLAWNAFVQGRLGLFSLCLNLTSSKLSSSWRCLSDLGCCEEQRDFSQISCESWPPRSPHSPLHSPALSWHFRLWAALCVCFCVLGWAGVSELRVRMRIIAALTLVSKRSSHSSWLTPPSGDRIRQSVRGTNLCVCEKVSLSMDQKDQEAPTTSPPLLFLSLFFHFAFLRRLPSSSWMQPHLSISLSCLSVYHLTLNSICRRSADCLPFLSSLPFKRWILSASCFCLRSCLFLTLSPSAL